MATQVAEKGRPRARKPDGHRRLRVRRIYRARHRAAALAVHQDGLPRGRPPQEQERHAAQAGRLQLHHQCRARQLRRGICAATTARAPAPWPSGSRTRRPRTSARSSSARPTSRSTSGDGELDIPAIEGIGGSRLFFVDRYGDERLDLRGRLRLPSRLAASGWPTRIRSSPTSTI